MTRVTDEDLAVVQRHTPWTTDVDERSRHRQCINAVIDELLALRKVAEAAVRYCGSPTGYRALKAALREAGL